MSEDRLRALSRVAGYSDQMDKRIADEIRMKERPELIRFFEGKDGFRALPPASERDIRSWRWRQLHPEAGWRVPQHCLGRCEQGTSSAMNALRSWIVKYLSDEVNVSEIALARDSRNGEQVVVIYRKLV
jgi:hypothetical protein